MKIVVTGGSGFVGSNLIKVLKQEDIVVNLDVLEPVDKDSFIKCDISDRQSVNEIFKTELSDADTIIHLAALSKEAMSNKQPDIYFRANVEGTFNVLNACLNTNIKKFIFASSYLVYGNSNETEVNETHHMNPKSVYAATKLCGETILNSFSTIYGIDSVIFRKCIIYGDNDPQKRVITLFIDSAKEGKDILVFGDKVLDFIFVNDVVDAYVKAVDYKKSNTFNIGSGKGYSLIKIAEIIKTKMNSTSKIVKMGIREGEVARYIADIHKVRKELGFQSNGDLMSFIDRQCAINARK